MKILAAMDSFKGSCTSYTAGKAVCNGIKNILPDADVINVPVADGGEGTIEAVMASMNGKERICKVTDPIGNEVKARYCVLPSGIAVIEMSAASGLLLVPGDKRNPMVTTTYGTGELIKAALDEGHTTILLGVGGSATNDGGAGMAQALGVSFRDKDGNELGVGGGKLSDLYEIDTSKIDKRLKGCKIIIASDVTNLLCGPNGASYMYGPQKGASPEMVKELDQALAHYAAVIREQVGIDVMSVPGSGAAGGIVAGILAFCNAEIKSGIEAVLDIVNFDNQLEDVDIVFTGEGRIDEQTVYGKVPMGVAKHAKLVGNIPVIAIAGSVQKGAEVLLSKGIDAIFSVADGPISLEESQERIEELLERTAESIMRTIIIGKRFGMDGAK